MIKAIEFILKFSIQYNPPNLRYLISDLSERGAVTFTTSKNTTTMFLTKSGCVFVNFVFSYIFGNIFFIHCQNYTFTTVIFEKAP